LTPRLKPAVNLKKTSWVAGPARRPVAVVPRAGEGTSKPPAREERSRRIRKLAASDFLRDQDVTGDELVSLPDLADEVKSHPGDFAQALAGKSIALLFEKPSLRTRLTFEVAMKQMGSGSVSAMESLRAFSFRLHEQLSSLHQLF
jgi:hypothetical protein